MVRSRSWVACAHVLLLLLLLLEPVSAIKECLKQVRLRWDEPDCQAPRFTRSYCHNCPDSEAMDSCQLVAHAFLVELELFDVVLLTAATCRAPIAQGPLLEDGLVRLLPDNDHLAVTRIQGRQLRDALLFGEGHNDPDAAPKFAGVQYDAEDVFTLSNSCHWETIQDDRWYTVLTTATIANGGYGYHLLHSGSSIDTSGHATRMELRVRDLFWKYANFVCEIVDPNRRPKQSHTPLQPKRIRVGGVAQQQQWLRLAVNHTAVVA